MMKLDFEKPIIKIEEKIEELKKMSTESGMDLSKEIETFETQAHEYKKNCMKICSLYKSSKSHVIRTVRIFWTGYSF